jgi:hypothetical protein
MISSRDLPVLRLQYEILNISAAQMAKETDIPESLIQETIEEEGWQQWWPEEPPVEIFKKQAAQASLVDDDLSDSDLLSQQSEDYIDRSRKRLQVYQLAKEIYLATKYLQLESALIGKAHEILEQCETLDATAIKQLSALYKDMKHHGVNSLLQAAVDDSGLPSLIVRDLSGT